MDEWTLDDLMRLAGNIGSRIESGTLPPRDAEGFYRFTDHDLTSVQP